MTGQSLGRSRTGTDYNRRNCGGTDSAPGDGLHPVICIVGLEHNVWMADADAGAQFHWEM